ncbi:MAG: glycerol-3-phosphate acyltransferase [Gammaproteobacteria bacterium RIFCSPLOWO2_02_FULL_61_13]|nr:MAG: glycerol-3-phosphate acyltransferase [Gammaproteobacteria bacterium RIFCSPLOWO2_02_FULL_61_13]
MLTNILLIAGAYLLGSVACAVVVCRAMGMPDPRVGGSGNPGATNVLRLHGKAAAVLTLAGDILKGLLPVFVARELQVPDWVVAATGVAAFAGHIYPVFFAFRGGKGVATLVGVLLGIHWALGAAFVGTWLLTAALFRYSSLSALIAAVLTPVYAWLLLPELTYVVALAALAAALMWRHRSNIRNLIRGEEEKIQFGSKAPTG